MIADKQMKEECVTDLFRFVREPVIRHILHISTADIVEIWPVELLEYVLQTQPFYFTGLACPVPKHHVRSLEIKLHKLLVIFMFVKKNLLHFIVLTAMFSLFTSGSPIRGSYMIMLSIC